MEDVETKSIIETKLCEKYPELETVCITKLTKSKKYGETVTYFKAVGTISGTDFDNYELDEDGNYPQKTCQIKGRMAGNLFKSSMEGRDEDFDLEDENTTTLV